MEVPFEGFESVLLEGGGDTKANVAERSEQAPAQGAYRQIATLRAALTPHLSMLVVSVVLEYGSIDRPQA
jgi:hypothetical protein